MPFGPTRQQRKAIEAPLGPVLVVAGPGAGKTACLIGRIGHLVANGIVPAERICAVTFTNKAAEEIIARLHEALGARAEQLRLGTIHALCADVLREYAEAAGLKPGFGIADEDYQRTVLRQMGQGRRAGELLRLFGRRQLMGAALTPGDERLFAEYQRQLRRRNLVDFDDLIVLTGGLFRTRPSIADAVAGRWDYLLVDEFQDVTVTQYAILRRLAAPHGNFFAVGDDEQSIFSWAGADPRVLQRFQRDYDIASPVLLDTNHRTTQQIFGVARRLLEVNPSLFQKDLTASRMSLHEVKAYALADDDEEATWVIGDIQADRAAAKLGWGDYAILYRRHEVGDRLEARLVKAGIPCRLAKGHPLAEDAVIGYVIAALRLVRDPLDAAAAEQFARRVLPPHLLERVQAEVGEGPEFLRAVRDLAAAMARDPESKKLWRLVFQVENLASLRHKHRRLESLVDELLAERVGRYRNALEERHEELADPGEVPGAAPLAARLLEAQGRKARIVLERMGGLEIGLRGMLFGAGHRLVYYADEVVQAELDDLRLGPQDAGPDGLAVTLFKALQHEHARDLGGAMERYVTFDLETTDVDADSCDIIEIAAVRVEHGRAVATFHSMVRPTRRITQGARRTHGIGEEEVAQAPRFAEVWPAFRAFVGTDTLVAHNAQRFDVPVLRRHASPLGGAEELRIFDTLPLARSLSGDSARLEALAERFGIERARAHRALDDARTLVGVYEELERRRVARSRRTALVSLLPYLGVSLALDARRRDTDEVRLLFERSRIPALGRYSDALEFYDAERRRTTMPSPSLEEVIERLGGRRLMEKLQEVPDAARRYPAAIARLATLVEQRDDEGLELAIGRFLERVALSASQGAEVDPHRVNLLTLHSTKGLEFSRVYVVGVEDEQIPGFFDRDRDQEAQVQEARRLLYVGMTRAKDRLVLTRVDRRGGRAGGGSRFLEEMRLDIERPETA
jgi:DNA polymerase III epsilon subunit family exonuclease